MKPQSLSKIFKGKVVVITGSSAGIGRCVAKKLGLAGAHIMLNGTSDYKLWATTREFQQAGIDAEGFLADVSIESECEKLMQYTVKRFGKIDIVIANAGVAGKAPLLQCSSAMEKKIFDVNVVGVANTIRHAAMQLKRTKGLVLITGSTIAFGAMPAYWAYAASKMALISLHKTLRIEFKEWQIHIALAFIGRTVNDSDKRALNIYGERADRLVKPFAKAQISPQDKVADDLIAMLVKKTPSKIFDRLGWVNAVVNKWMPGVALRILSSAYHREKHSATVHTLQHGTA